MPIIHSAGGLSFVRCGVQDSSAVTSVLATSLRLPSVSLNVFASLATSEGGGSSATKCARQFLRDVLRRRRMPRQIGEHGAALLDAGVGIALAEHGLGARLVQPLDESEFAAVDRAPRAESRSSR